MLKKIKKLFPAVVSAVLCFAMAFGTAASAADNNADIWKNAKALTSAKYNSKYIKWAEKYGKKSAINTVAYSKSRTKKFLDKVMETTEGDDPEYSVCFIDDGELVYYSFKHGNYKIVISEISRAIYVNNKVMTLLALDDKTSVQAESGYECDGLKETWVIMMIKTVGTIGDKLFFNIDDTTEGKSFKFKSGEKIYLYEEFKCYSEYTDIKTAGFLFDEKGSPLAVNIDGEAVYMSFKAKVDDSEFDIPKDYKNVDCNDFNF